MSHARIEEVSDSDPDIDDPSDFLPDSDQIIIQTADAPSPSASKPTVPSRALNPTFARPPPPQQSQNNAEAREAIKSYQVIYPVYFDATRTRAQGRRVSSKLAVPNPLAYNLLPAAQNAFAGTNLQMAFEPDRTHPKDWSNPGRIRIQLYDPETHKPLHPTIKNKSHLYTLIAKYLKSHPTQPEDPLQLRIPGLPIPEKFTETEISKPRGWKLGSVLPVHSCAVSGGGVKDDFFKEAMEELRQAQGQGQLPGAPGGGMPDMSALQGMMQSMQGMQGLGGGGGAPSGGGESSSGKKKKDKKKG